MSRVKDEDEQGQEGERNDDDDDVQRYGFDSVSSFRCLFPGWRWLAHHQLCLRSGGLGRAIAIKRVVVRWRDRGSDERTFEWST